MKRTPSVICLLIAFSLIGIPSIAQPPETLWMQTFGGADGEDGFNVQQTSDGGFIITGCTRSFGAGDDDVWLIKTDSAGNEEWSQTFGGTDDDCGRGVQQTTDDGYIITGLTASYGAGDNDVWLIKTDSDGNELWSRTFGGLYDEYGDEILQTADGGYIIIGGKYTGPQGGSDIWLIKTDSAGNEEWSQTFGGMGQDEGYGGQQTLDGGYIITGLTASFGAGDYDIWLIKTDSAGNEEWSQTFGGIQAEFGWSVQQTDNGGYIIAGTTNSFGAGSYDTWLIKTDINGNEVWNQTFGGIDNDAGSSVQQCNDGGYIITGSTASLGAGMEDAWLIKTNEYGYEDWSQTFGGAYFEFGNSVKQTTDGGFVIVGTTESFGAGGCDVWLIRVAADGTEVTEDITSVPTEFLLDEVYPNPFNPTATISIALPTPSELRVSVINTLGKEVAVLAVGQFTQGYQQFTFDATGLSSGIYFVKATVPGQMNEMRKIVYMK